MTDYAKRIATATIEIERLLPASCERVWEYLTDPELRQRWFCGGATGTKPGEEFVMDFDHTRLSTSSPPEGTECGNAVVVHGEILTCEPPHLLAYNWPEEDGSGSVVTIRLTQEGEYTRLNLVHSKLENPEFFKGASAGWHAHLDLLRDLIQGLEAKDFWVHYGQLKQEYDSQDLPADAAI